MEQMLLFGNPHDRNVFFHGHLLVPGYSDIKDILERVMDIILNLNSRQHSIVIMTEEDEHLE